MTALVVGLLVGAVMGVLTMVVVEHHTSTQAATPGDQTGSPALHLRLESLEARIYALEASRTPRTIQRGDQTGFDPQCVVCTTHGHVPPTTPHVYPEDIPVVLTRLPATPPTTTRYPRPPAGMGGGRVPTGIAPPHPRPPVGGSKPSPQPAWNDLHGACHHGYCQPYDRGSATDPCPTSGYTRNPDTRWSQPPTTPDTPSRPAGRTDGLRDPEGTQEGESTTTITGHHPLPPLPTTHPGTGGQRHLTPVDTHPVTPPPLDPDDLP